MTEFNINSIEEKNLPINFITFFKEVLEPENYELCEFTNDASVEPYKKAIIRMLKILRYSVECTIKNTDRWHISMITNELTIGINDIDQYSTIEEISEVALTIFAKVSFLLLGDIPCDGEHRKRLNQQSLTLNKYRSIHYTQTDEQKVALINDIIEKRIFESKIHDEDKSTIKQKMDSYKHNSTKFIEWFREEYPEMYSKIF